MLTTTLIYCRLKYIDAAWHSELPIVRQAKAQRLREFGNPARRDGGLQRGEPHLAMELGELGPQGGAAAQSGEKAAVM